MQSAQIKAMVQEQAVRAALEAEKQLDRALKQMDDIGENEIQALRKQRLKALKDKQAKMAEWRAKGHGSYNEVASQKDWFNECKDNERVVSEPQ